MRGFEARGDVAVAELDSEERAVVARVIADVGLLLDGESFGMEREQHEDAEEELFRHLRGFEAALSDPEDPAVLRILPNAAPTDREVADEFRRLTEPELRATKVDRLRVMWRALSEDGPEWEVAADQAMATAAALTDVRLVLAARLGLDTDEDAEALHRELEMAERAVATGDASNLAVDPERIWLGMLYQALSWLQESLMTYVMRDDV
ncbi:MAG: DUF2017 family protein [Demequina sp.]|uniref:DUF2017 family protein n=1 Tax=Demequina sp. TaxID=2050685 RepID=UPI00199F80A9|nr:DUF2017 family protein [Demequina sp.]MBC7299120.1 DUF2017 family protein [Demequina sp.]